LFLFAFDYQSLLTVVGEQLLNCCEISGKVVLQGIFHEVFTRVAFASQ